MLHTVAQPGWLKLITLPKNIVFFAGAKVENVTFVQRRSQNIGFIDASERNRGYIATRTDKKPADAKKSDKIRAQLVSGPLSHVPNKTKLTQIYTRLSIFIRPVKQ